MSSQILQASKAKGRNTSFRFIFKSPKTGLSLRGASVDEEGVPKLIFDAANYENTPSLTEEDVATVARVVSEGQRPEFFYMNFLNPSHPFSTLGRWYKAYSPQWLRGTSVGNLLSEADWQMKCLHVGARSNETKREFSSWPKTSKLDNLAVHIDFENIKPNGSIMMSCKKVETEESKNELSFLGEPKMQIIDETSPDYSKYITEYYDSVAYYDEPLLLKMKELMKLILAMEWMKKKGIRFERKWTEQHTNKPHKSLSQAIMPSEGKRSMDRLVKLFENKETVHSTGPYGPVSMETEITKQIEAGIEITFTKSCPALDLKEITIVRASYDDHDFLYEGMDCKQVITLGEKGFITPDVNSWSELYAETVPHPCAINRDLHNPEQIECNFGGVQTKNIPVTKARVERVTKTENSVSITGTRTRHTQDISHVPERTTPRTRPQSTLHQPPKRGAMSRQTCTGYVSNGEGRFNTEDNSKVTVDPIHGSVEKMVEIDHQTLHKERFGSRSPGLLSITQNGAPTNTGATPNVLSPNNSDGIRSPPDYGTQQHFNKCNSLKRKKQKETTGIAKTTKTQKNKTTNCNQKQSKIHTSTPAQPSGNAAKNVVSPPITSESRCESIPQVRKKNQKPSIVLPPQPGLNPATDVSSPPLTPDSGYESIPQVQKRNQKPSIVLPPQPGLNPATDVGSPPLTPDSGYESIPPAKTNDQKLSEANTPTKPSGNITTDTTPPLSPDSVDSGIESPPPCANNGENKFSFMDDIINPGGVKIKHEDLSVTETDDDDDDDDDDGGSDTDMEITDD